MGYFYVLSTMDGSIFNSNSDISRNIADHHTILSLLGSADLCLPHSTNGLCDTLFQQQDQHRIQVRTSHAFLCHAVTVSASVIYLEVMTRDAVPHGAQGFFLSFIPPVVLSLTLWLIKIKLFTNNKQVPYTCIRQTITYMVWTTENYGQYSMKTRITSRMSITDCIATQ